MWKVPAGNLKWGTTYAWQVQATAAVGGSVTSAYRVLVTAARQPMIGAQLAAGSQTGQDFEPSSGNYTSTVTDASVATVGPELSVVRSYNSMDARRDGLFGAGWSTRYDMRISAEPGGSLLVTYPDGKRLRFAPKGDGSFQAPSGMYAALAEVSGGGWKLRDRSSTVYHFTAQGRLAKITDNRGRAQGLTYGTDGKLAKVTGVGGRSLTFTWTGAHVTGVATDPVSGKSLTWTYGYDGDKLISVCHAEAAPNCTRYDYGTGSPYRGVVEDDEPVGYWRLDEPAVKSTPTPTPDPTAQPTTCPRGCEPEPTTKAESWGWGAGQATYEQVSLEQPGALAGTANTAASFTGTSRVRLPDHALARLADQLSLELWFKTSTSGMLAYAAPKEPVMTERDDGGSPLLYVGTDGKLRGQFRVLDAGGAPRIDPITSAASVANGQWHHVVLAGSGNTQTLYLDGAAVGTLAGTIDHNWLGYASIGDGITKTGWPAAKPPNSGTGLTAWGFSGQIDEVAVYDRALNAGQNTAHFAARAAAPHALAKITLPSGRVWADNTYDSAKDRLLTHTDQHGGTWKLTTPSPVDPKTGIATISYSDPQGGTLSAQFDAWRGYRLKSWTDQKAQKSSALYDSAGYMQELTRPDGVVTNSSHDERGNLLATVSCTPGPGTQSVDEDYDNPYTCFRQGASTPIAGRAWYTYRVNENDDFDPRNDRLTAFRDGRSNSNTDNTYATTLEYNQYGEEIKQTTPATLDFPNGRSSSVAYTDGSEPAVGGGTIPAGLVKTRTDARNNATTFGYTATGDLAEENDPAGLVTTYQYDALGRVTTQAQISDAEPGGVKTTFTYDNLSRLATQTSAGVKNEITGVIHTAKAGYTYDPDGNTLTATVTDLTGGDPARTTTYTYDPYGHQESATDPEGGVIRTTWNRLGQQATVTDQMGSVFGYAYTERGEHATTTLKNWTGSPVNPQPAKDIVLESFSYEPAGRLAARLDPMGRKTSYAYNAADQLSTVTGEAVKLNDSTTAKNVTLEANTYDPAGNLTKHVTGDGFTATDYVYDAAGRLTSATLDPGKLKRKTVFTYDANNHVTKETRTGAPDGTREESVTYAYNTVGILTRQTVENGDDDLTTTWTIDDRGLPTAITDPRGTADGASAADYTTSNRYDALGRLIEIKAPNVTIDKAGTTQQARPTTRIGYNSAGWQTHVTDPEGRLSTTGFDRMGRRTSLTAMPYTPPGATQVTPKLGYAYDPGGRPIKVTDPRGQITTTEYDALGNPVRGTNPPAAPGQPAGQWISEYNLAGEELAAIDPTGARTQATYDDLGRQITRTMLERKPASAIYTTKLYYNDAGYLTKEVLPGDKTTDYEPNAAGEVETVTDPARDITRNTYDLAGRPAKTTNPLGNAMVGEYDLAGRLTGVKSLDDTGATVRTVGLGYDAAGNPTRFTSGEGHVTRRSYDATNLLIELIEPVSASESITTRFGYDATGARTRLTDGRGNATWTGYNSLGLIETLTEPATTAHPNPADRTWTHVYDAAGNETALLQPGGVRHDKQYDNLNRLTKISGSGAGIVAADKTYGYDLADRPTTVGDQQLEYNDRSLLTKLTPPTGTGTAFAYDALGNPTKRIDVTGTTTYTWDADSRLKTVTDPVSGRTNTYDYDGADRLKTITSANPANTQSYTYDALDRPKTHTLTSSSGGQLAKIIYGWDKDDNLTSKATEGLAGAGTNTYGYDHAGRLTSWTGPDGTTTAYAWDAAGNRTKAGDKTYTYDERNRLTAGDGSTYTYTPRGTLASQTKNGNTRNLTFDAFDRLINDGDATYTYDAFDRMLTRQKAGGQQHFAYAGLDNDIIAITNNTGAVQSSYGRDPFGGLISVKEGGNPATGALTDLHHDLVGTFTGTALSSTTSYNPFGEVTAQTGTKPALGYQSEYTDPDTGNINMHARWYQPGTSTFTSRDTWTLSPMPSIQANRYTYGSGAPLTGLDPSGHQDVIHCGCGGTPGAGVVLPGYGSAAVNGAAAAGAAAAAAAAVAKSTAAVAAANAAAASRAAAARARRAAKNGTAPRGWKPTQATRQSPNGDERREPRSSRRPNEDGSKRTPKGRCTGKNCVGTPTVPQPRPAPRPQPQPKPDRKPDPKPKPPVSYGGKLKTGNCGKKCTVEGAPPLEDPCPLAPGAVCENPDRVELPDVSIADPVGVPADDSDPDTSDIINCDDGPRNAGQCVDGVAAVDPDESDSTTLDYGDPPPPTEHYCWVPFRDDDDGVDMSPQDQTLPASLWVKPGQALRAGEYNYVVMPDGSLRAVHVDDMWPAYEDSGHTSLSKEQPVHMAGMFTVDETGTIVGFDQFSGHYKPGHKPGYVPMENVVREAFARHGLPGASDANWDPTSWQRRRC